jgi:uncharacterized damage-inducible protein DinB
MAQQTASEKDMYLQTFQRECQITLRLLKAFPKDKADFRPHPKSRTALELASVFAGEQGICDMALKGKIDFGSGKMPGPVDLAQAISAFESAMNGTYAKVSQAGDDVLGRTVQFPVGPGKMGDLRAMDILWTTLMDQVHHRGQLSVYLRLAGGKVPSIYGPTADEPWM